MSNFAIDPMGRGKQKYKNRSSWSRSPTPNGVQSWGENPQILDNLLGILPKKHPGTYPRPETPRIYVSKFLNHLRVTLGNTLGRLPPRGGPLEFLWVESLSCSETNTSSTRQGYHFFMLGGIHIRAPIHIHPSSTGIQIMIYMYILDKFKYYTYL